MAQDEERWFLVFSFWHFFHHEFFDPICVVIHIPRPLRLRLFAETWEVGCEDLDLLALQSGPQFFERVLRPAPTVEAEENGFHGAQYSFSRRPTRHQVVHEHARGCREVRHMHRCAHIVAVIGCVVTNFSRGIF